MWSPLYPISNQHMNHWDANEWTSIRNSQYVLSTASHRFIWDRIQRYNIRRSFDRIHWLIGLHNFTWKIHFWNFSIGSIGECVWNNTNLYLIFRFANYADIPTNYRVFCGRPSILIRHSKTFQNSIHGSPCTAINMNKM